VDLSSEYISGRAGIEEREEAKKQNLGKTRNGPSLEDYGEEQGKGKGLVRAAGIQEWHGLRGRLTRSLPEEIKERRLFTLHWS